MPLLQRTLIVAVVGATLCAGVAHGQWNWIRTAGPAAAPCTQVHKHPGGVIVLTTAYGRVYRSTDHAESWRDASTGLGGNWATNIARDPLTDHLYLCTALNGVYVSTDTAQTWTSIGPPSKNIVDCAFPGGGVIVAASTDGIWRSTNNGFSWSLRTSGLASTDILCLATKPNGHIFAGTAGGGVFRSTDAADTWLPANTGITTASITALLFVPTNNHLYAGTASGGVLQSSDNGATWSQGGLVPYVVQHLTMGVTSLTIHASTAGNGVFQSDDLGVTWSQIGAGIPNGDVRNVILNQHADLVAATYGNGVWKSSNNGANWWPKDNGLDIAWMRCLATDAAGGLVAGVRFGGLFRTINQGALWQRHGLGGVDVAAFVSRLPDSTWFVAGSRGLSQSTNRGLTWSHSMPGFRSRMCNDIVLGAAGLILVGASDSGVFRTVNDGVTWARATGSVASRDVSCLAAVGAGTFLAGSAQVGGLHRSTNNGVSWTEITGVPFTRVLRLAVRSADGAVFAAGNDGIYRSIDGGSTWTKKLPARSALQGTASLAINQVNGHIFAAWTDSVFTSANSGDRWTNITGDLPPGTITTLHVAADQYLYLGNLTDGVYRSGVMVPVRFTAISAVRDGHDVALRWSTADERKAVIHEVERRAADGAEPWTPVAVLQARGRAAEYETHDRNAPNIALEYRVRGVDADGTHTYSPIARVLGISSESGIEIFPNPVPLHGRAVIRSMVLDQGAVVLDRLGREVLRVNPTSGGVLDASALPGPGLYFIRARHAAAGTARAFVVLP